MKKISLLMFFCLATVSAKAQDIDALFVFGEENAERFANDYLKSATNGLMHSINQVEVRFF